MVGLRHRGVGLFHWGQPTIHCLFWSLVLYGNGHGHVAYARIVRYPLTPIPSMNSISIQKV